MQKALSFHPNSRGSEVDPAAACYPVSGARSLVTPRARGPLPGKSHCQVVGSPALKGGPGQHQNIAGIVIGLSFPLNGGDIFTYYSVNGNMMVKVYSWYSY